MNFIFIITRTFLLFFITSLSMLSADDDLIKKEFFTINKKIFTEEIYASLICYIETNNPKFKTKENITLQTYLEINDIVSGREDLVLINLFKRKKEGMVNITNKELLSEEYFGRMYNNKYPDDMLVDHKVYDKKDKQDPGTYFDKGYRTKKLKSVSVIVFGKDYIPISPNYQHNLKMFVDFPNETVGPGYYKGPDRNWYTWSSTNFNDLTFSSNKKNREHVKLEYHLSREKDEKYGAYELQIWYYDSTKTVGAKQCFCFKYDMENKKNFEDSLKLFVNGFENWTQNRKLVLDSAKKNIKELENKKDF